MASDIEEVTTDTSVVRSSDGRVGVMIAGVGYMPSLPGVRFALVLKPGRSVTSALRLSELIGSDCDVLMAQIAPDVDLWNLRRPPIDECPIKRSIEARTATPVLVGHAVAAE